MNCSKCGSPLTPDLKFCNVCGAGVSQNVNSVNQGVNQNIMSNPVNEIKTEVNPVNQGVQPMSNSLPSVDVNVGANTSNQIATPEVVVQSSNEGNLNGGIEGVTPIPNNNLNGQVFQTPMTNVNQSNVQIPNDSGVVTSPVNQVPVSEEQVSPNNGAIMTNQMNNEHPQQPTSPKQKSGVNKTGVIVVIVAVVVIFGLIAVLVLTGGLKFHATITANGTTKQFDNRTTKSVSNQDDGGSSIQENNEGTTRPMTTNPVSNNGSLSLFDKIKQIDLNTIKSYEQVVSIMGTEGVKDEKIENQYVWTQDEKTSMEVKFYVSTYSDNLNKIGRITIKYEQDDLRNPSVDLSNAMSIVNTINAQTPVYYNEIANSFGVDGNLVELTSYAREYIWVNANGGYVSARFNPETSQCTYIFAVVR